MELTTPLHYAVTASSNPLDAGEYALGSRYQTYGQHSFIFDFIATR